MHTFLTNSAQLASNFAPHGYCFLFDPTLLWGMVIADLLIAASYYSIPVALIYFAHKRKDIDNHQLLWKFGAFILLCGTTHLVYLWNIWHSNYYLEMFLKMATGIVSFYVAIFIWKVIPLALKIPSPSALSNLNKKLSDSEARYRDLFETANQGVVTIDSNGKITLANDRMASYFHLNKEDLIETNIKKYVCRDDVKTLEENIEQVFSGNKCHYDICFVGNSNEQIDTLVSSSQIKSSEGEVTGALLVVTDVTEKNTILNKLESLNQELEGRVQERTSELKLANEQLTQKMEAHEIALSEEKSAKAKMDAFFNNSPNGIIITNRKGIITDINTVTETMFGYKRSELISKHVNMLTPDDFAEEHSQHIEKADTSFTTKKLGFGRKLTAARRYNTQFSVDVALTKIAHSDEHYYMAVIRDLTEIDVVENELRSVNTRLQETVDSLKTQTRETTLLNEYTELLQTSQEFQQYPAIISAYSKSILGATNAETYIVKKDNLLHAIDGSNEETFQTKHCWALKANHAYPLNERQREIPCEHTTSDGNSICLPLSATGQQLGLIVLTMPDNFFSKNNTFLDVFEKTLQAFAIRTSICLASLRLLKEKELQSFKDELTGLYNRRFMNESLASYFPRASREKKPLTLLMADVDHFKKFNDTYGHDLGDRVLIQLAKTLKQTLRETDLICRFGGEEFLVVLYDATEKDAIEKANKIHDTMKTIVSFPMPITVSIGVAEKSDHDNVESLIRHADMALYEAKENGRNQTQCYKSNLLHGPTIPPEGPRPSGV